MDVVADVAIGFAAPSAVSGPWRELSGDVHMTLPAGC
jgi:hypothetical protein